MRLEPLKQWNCDTCGCVIKDSREGTIEFRYRLDAQTTARHTNFRIVHNGNVNNGSCQSAAKPGGDMLLEDLSGERGILRMLRVQSSHPSWAEAVRRLLVPYYEEARQYFKKARADGIDVTDDKLTSKELILIINTFSE